MDQGGQKKHDILQGLIDAKSESAEKDQASEDEILAEAMIPIVAGSDSTATAIRAIVLELARHAPVLTKLRQELHEAWRKGSISEPVQLAETSNLRYLDPSGFANQCELDRPLQSSSAERSPSAPKVCSFTMLAHSMTAPSKSLQVPRWE